MELNSLVLQFCILGINPMNSISALTCADLLCKQGKGERTHLHNWQESQPSAFLYAAAEFLCAGSGFRKEYLT